MSDAQVVALAIAIGGSLISAVWFLVNRELNRQAEAIEKRATITALDAAEDRHREEMKDMRSQLHTQLAEVNRRQDREIDMINSSIARVDHGVAELRKEMLAGNAAISQSLQNIQSTINRGRRNE